MSVRMTLFKPIYIDQRIDLSPTEFREAAADINGYLLEKMRTRMEGKCTTHGFVRNGSMQILARSMGQAEHGRFTGSFIYYCKIRIDCFLPYAEQVVDGRILKMNKLGAYALLSENGEDLEAMRILLPRDLHLGNASFDSLTVGSLVRMRLLRSRFQANDAFIQAVALYDSTLVSGAIKKMIDAAGVPLRPVPEGDENAKTNIESKEDELNEEDKIDIPALLPAVTETIAV
jgi:DNA-directed RNA polymerase subunit E'/Rpb7